MLISITPRIVRGPKVTEDDMVPLRVGTQEVPQGGGPAPVALRARRRRAPATPQVAAVPQAPANGGPPAPPRRAAARELPGDGAADSGRTARAQAPAPLTAAPQPPGAGPEGAAVSTPDARRPRS